MSHLAWRGPPRWATSQLASWEMVPGGHVGMGAPALTHGPARGSGSDSLQHTQTRMAWHGMAWRARLGQSTGGQGKRGEGKAWGREGKGWHAWLGISWQAAERACMIHHEHSSPCSAAAAEYTTHLYLLQPTFIMSTLFVSWAIHCCPWEIRDSSTTGYGQQSRIR